MGRIYIASTPASRGEVEVDEDANESLIPEGVSHEDALEALEQVAAELGYELVAIEPEAGSGEKSGDDTGGDTGEESKGEKPADEPAGNATTEDWAAYAVKFKGATEKDLLDEDGKPLGRDALREKYGTPAS